MPAANIKINAVAASNTDLPINTLVQLDNANIGGELTFNWTILDQPPGAVDVLSSTVIQNPTFTPKKEGTYLLKLVVNLGLGTEQTDIKVAAVRQLKTRDRVPAAGETLEADTADGWATDVDSILRRVDNLYSPEFGIHVGIAAVGGLSRGDVLRVVDTATIKLGLPGEELVPSWNKAPATLSTNLNSVIGILEGGADGSTTPAVGAVIRVRLLGRFGPIGGVAVLGGTVYVSNLALPSIVGPGTNYRALGMICRASGGTYDIWMDGTGRADLVGQSLLINGNISANGNIDAQDIQANGNLMVSGTSALDGDITTGGDIIMGGGTDIRQTSTRLRVGTDTANPLVFETNNVDRWEITSAGVFQAVGGDRKIANVLDPVAAQDAATKAYVDSVIGFRQSVTSEITVDTTTGSVVFVDLLTAAITTTAGGILIIMFTASASNSSATSDMPFVVLIDGVIQRGTAIRQQTANEAEAGGITLRRAVAAGVHSIKIQWRVFTNTGQIRPVTQVDFEHASLVVMEVGS